MTGAQQALQAVQLSLFSERARGAERQSLEEIKLFLTQGGDIDQLDHGNTRLILAAIRGHSSVVRFLIEQGADIDIKNGNDHTALMMAVLNKHKDVVDQLLSAGATVDEGCVAGAELKRVPEIKQMLLDAAENRRQHEASIAKQQTLKDAARRSKLRLTL